MSWHWYSRVDRGNTIFPLAGWISYDEMPSIESRLRSSSSWTSRAGGKMPYTSILGSASSSNKPQCSLPGWFVIRYKTPRYKTPKQNQSQKSTHFFCPDGITGSCCSSMSSSSKCRCRNGSPAKSSSSSNISRSADDLFWLQPSPPPPPSSSASSPRFRLSVAIAALLRPTIVVGWISTYMSVVSQPLGGVPKK